jgi:nucleoside-diphosphate-sugar epimerase
MMGGLASLANKRLVILGCGYVGTAVARQARAAGLKVEALTRNPARAAELVALDVRTVVDDLAAESWHGRLAPGADWVLNCVSSGSGGPGGYRHSYIDGMRSLLAWARSGPAGTLIYTSSTSVYSQDNGAVVDETAPTDSGDETRRLLLEAEELLRGESAACNRWFILRLAGIYGPGRHHLLDQVRAGSGELAGSGAHHLNLAHRDDICAAILTAFTAPVAVRHEVFNVADDLPATKAAVASWLAERVGQPPPHFSGGASSRRRGFAAPPDRIVSNGKLKTMLGWKPAYPSYREGFAAILSA